MIPSEFAPIAIKVEGNLFRSLVAPARVRPIAAVQLQNRLAGDRPYRNSPPQFTDAGLYCKSEVQNLPTVSLHVHERIDPRSILEAARVAVARKLGIRLWIILRDEIDYQEFHRRGQKQQGTCSLAFGCFQFLLNTFLV